MIRHTEIISTHFCRPCKYDFIHTWHKEQWFGDYSRQCPRCERNVGFIGTKDFSYDKQEDWERRWENR